ncbi:MAG: ABC transporter substrate-binding protein [Lachnospiraceae bacterium]|nr:ABC transporter substrate-binding protein [Lachnospiraceae bacterium]
MNMRKKVIAFLLTAGMLVSCLVGCGQKNNGGSAGTTSGSTDSAQQQEEIATVTWCVRATPEEDDELVLEEMNKLLEERYNLHLNMVFISPSDFNQRMQLMSTSNEDYDLCFTSTWANYFYDNVNREAFLSLNDLLESDAAADLMAVYPDGLEEVARVDGNVYALPNYQLIYHQLAAFIQKDLADKYELDLDAEYDTIVDLLPFMEEVRDNEKDLFVLNETQNIRYMTTVGIFDDIATFAYVYRDDPEYKVHFLLETPEIIEQYRTMNSWFHSGILRSDLATAIDVTADEAANRYAISLKTAKPGGEAEFTNTYQKEYVQVSFGEPYLQYNAGAATMTAINVNSKNPEAAIKLYGVMWTDKEIYNMALFGIEGVHYNKVSENRIELVEGRKYNKSGLSWAIGNQFNAYLLPGQEDGIWEETEELNRTAEVSHLAGFNFDTSAVETEMAQCNSVWKEYERQAYYADDYDVWLTEITTKMKAAGIDTIIAEVQKQIDEWRVANGK